MAEKNQRPIIIKKVKKVIGGAHHGGAWKIAYADFVTAMMAFFLLLWLLSSLPQKKLHGIADYFTPSIGLPSESGSISIETGAEDKDSSTNNKTADGIMFGAQTASTIAQLSESVRKTLEALDAKNFSSIQQDLYKSIHDNPELKEFADSINIDQTPEGLRIQLVEKEKRPLFIPGTSKLEPYTAKLLDVIAKYIRYMPNYLSVDGHTNKDKKVTTVDNWQLSTDRALVTRNYLIDAPKLDPEQVLRVVGYADETPKNVKDPYALENIRISLILLRNTLIPYYKQMAPQSILYDTKKP